jgi:hypothetical protein
VRDTDDTETEVRNYAAFFKVIFVCCKITYTYSLIYISCFVFRHVFCVNLFVSTDNLSCKYVTVPELISFYSRLPVFYFETKKYDFVNKYLSCKI